MQEKKVVETITKNEQKDDAEIKYLDVKGLAKMLSMSKGAVYRMGYHREIPYRKLGRRVLFRADEILELIESKRVDADPRIAEAITLTKKPQAA